MRSDGSQPDLLVKIPSSLEYVRPVRKWVEAMLACEGWGEEDVADVGLVATEILQNAVEHGTRNDGAEVVRVHFLCEPGEVLLEVEDPGTGKGPVALLTRDVTTAPPLDASRGRGLFLVNRMSRELDRVALPDGGSLVRVRFRWSAVS